MTCEGKSKHRKLTPSRERGNCFQSYKCLINSFATIKMKWPYKSLDVFYNSIQVRQLSQKVASSMEAENGNWSCKLIQIGLFKWFSSHCTTMLVLYIWLFVQPCWIREYDFFMVLEIFLVLEQVFGTTLVLQLCSCDCLTIGSETVNDGTHF